MRSVRIPLRSCRARQLGCQGRNKDFADDKAKRGANEAERFIAEQLQKGYTERAYRTMTSDTAGPLLPHGGYRRLRSYKVAEAVYDATVVFCRRFVIGDKRLTDQMVHAARSGVRNISEGSGAAATSRKTEMKLTNVARASLSDELARDYESFLVQNGLRVWPKESQEARAMRARLQQDRIELKPATDGRVRLAGLGGLSDFVAKAQPELAGNAMLCAVNQAAYLLRRQLESQSKLFAEKGGFTENLYNTRTRARALESRTDPMCPICGKRMRRKIARNGRSAGQEFWGCSGYPDCRKTLPITQTATHNSD